MSVAPLKREEYIDRSQLQQVEGETSIVRDKYSRALLLNDQSVLQKYAIQQRDRIEKYEAKERIAQLEDTVDELKTDIKEIKQLLRAIVKN